MDDIRQSIAENLVKLRTESGMTQYELAEKLNYSDKAVSKWERAESIPDVTVLKSIADLFGVSVDYLLTCDHTPTETPAEKGKNFNASPIVCISVLLVWLIATAVYVAMSFAVPALSGRWLAFVFAVPVSLIVWLVMNSVWFDRRRNYLIISLLMWSVLAAVYLTFLSLGVNVWRVFLPGIPGQLIVLLWAKIRTVGKSNTAR